jgi:hypothetical protein
MLIRVSLFYYAFVSEHNERTIYLLATFPEEMSTRILYSTVDYGLPKMPPQNTKKKKRRRKLRIASHTVIIVRIIDVEPGELG